MPIDVTAAEQISGLEVFGLGIGLVFVGLICIIIICSITGAICKALIKDDKKAPAAAKATGSDNIPNKGEFIAAVSAAIAEELGKDVSKLRILSVKKL